MTQPPFHTFVEYDRIKEPLCLSFYETVLRLQVEAGPHGRVSYKDIMPADRIFILKQLRRHNRKVMKSNLLKGGRWKRNQAPRDIKGFRLFDTVLYNNLPAYVHGRRSSGFFVIKDAEGRTISNSVSYKRLKLIRHCNAHLAFTMPAGPV